MTHFFCIALGSIFIRTDLNHKKKKEEEAYFFPGFVATDFN